MKIESGRLSHRAFVLVLFAALAIASAVTLSRPIPAFATPTAAADEASATEDATLTVPAPGVLGNDGVEFTGSLVASLVCGPAHGSLDLDADGSFRYSPEADFNGVDQFTYRAGDGIQWSEPATVTITVAPVPEPTRVLTTSRSLTLQAYRQSYMMTGNLVDDGGPIAGCLMTLQVSADGTRFSATGSSAITAADGSFAFRVVPASTTYYRVTFAGKPPDWLGSSSQSVRVIPRPRVGTPAAPSVMYAYRRATVTASLTPKHRAGSSIRIYKYLRTSTGWKASGYVKATTSDGTHYRGAMSFPRAGRWRLRAYAGADGGHAWAWSAGSDYVTVKSRGQLAVAIARRYLGRPYSSGGQGPGAFCCSGLTRRVYAEMGISLPSTASRQFSHGPRVSTRDLRPGDLVFYYRPVAHVGIYIGGGKMIDANHPGGSVGIRGLYPGLVGATRPWR